MKKILCFLIATLFSFNAIGCSPQTVDSVTDSEKTHQESSYQKEEEGEKEEESVNVQEEISESVTTVNLTGKAFWDAKPAYEYELTTDNSTIESLGVVEFLCPDFITRDSLDEFSYTINNDSAYIVFSYDDGFYLDMLDIMPNAMEEFYKESFLTMAGYYEYIPIFEIEDVGENFRLYMSSGEMLDQEASVNYWCDAYYLLTEEGITVAICGTTKTAKYNYFDAVFNTMITLSPRGYWTGFSESESEIDTGTSTIIKEGMYKVGADIEPGIYYITALDDWGAYWCINEDSAGDSILANDIVSTFGYFEVSEGEYLEISDGYAIPAEVAPIPEPAADGSYGDGHYLVGRDIPAGEYNAIAEDGEYGYWCISYDPCTYDIYENDLFENNSYVTIFDGQYIAVEDAALFPVN